MALSKSHQLNKLHFKYHTCMAMGEVSPKRGKNLHDSSVSSKFLEGGRGGVVDGEGGSSETCLKWCGGSLRDLSKSILKQGVGKGKSCS